MTKNVKSHLYGISLYVLEKQLWSASGDNVRVYDPASGKLLKMVDAKTNESIRCLLVVGTLPNHQVWCGASDRRIYVFDGEKFDFIKVSDRRR